jgi:hypothetical protein
MADDERRVFLTVDQALSALPEGTDDVHTFLNPGPNILLGADWRRETLETAIRSAAKLEIGGGQCRAMQHGLVLWKGPTECVFVEARETVLAELERAAATTSGESSGASTGEASS